MSPASRTGRAHRIRNSDGLKSNEELKSSMEDLNNHCRHHLTSASMELADKKKNQEQQPSNSSSLNIKSQVPSTQHENRTYPNQGTDCSVLVRGSDTGAKEFSTKDRTFGVVAQMHIHSSSNEILPANGGM
jgi:hypothetical protein